jgi:hypothetical protein
MRLYTKPVINAYFPEDNKNPDWLIYQEGEYSNPAFVLSDLEMMQFISYYLNFHNLATVESKEKE